MAKRPRSEEFRRKIGRAMDRYPTLGVTTVDPSALNPPDAVGELLASAASLTTLEELRRLEDKIALAMREERAELTQEMRAARRADDHRMIKALEVAGKDMARDHAETWDSFGRLRANAESYQQQAAPVEQRTMRRKYVVVGLDGVERDI